MLLFICLKLRKSQVKDLKQLNENNLKEKSLLHFYDKFCSKNMKDTPTHASVICIRENFLFRNNFTRLEVEAHI